MSPGTTTTPGPSAPTASSRAAPWRASTTTVQPSATSERARARPKPLEAPVTRALRGADERVASDMGDSFDRDVPFLRPQVTLKIGRTSCRERVCQYV